LRRIVEKRENTRRGGGKGKPSAQRNVEPFNIKKKSWGQRKVSSSSGGENVSQQQDIGHCKKER